MRASDFKIIAHKITSFSIVVAGALNGMCVPVDCLLLYSTGPQQLQHLK